MQGDPAWAQGFSNQQRGGIPEARLVESESSPIEQLAEAVADVPGRFVSFLKISAKRAFRLRIEPSEVLPDEREALAAENPADRRRESAGVPRVAALGAVPRRDAAHDPVRHRRHRLVQRQQGRDAGALRQAAAALAETAFCAICWLAAAALGPLAQAAQRGCSIGWLLFMLTPFIVFIYPLRAAFVGRPVDEARAGTRSAGTACSEFDPGVSIVEKTWGGEPFWGLGYEWDRLVPDRAPEGAAAKLIELCETEMRANAKRSDDELLYPRRNFEILAENGFLGLTVPEEYGGLGENHVAFTMVCETLAATAAPPRPCVTSCTSALWRRSCCGRPPS